MNKSLQFIAGLTPTTFSFYFNTFNLFLKYTFISQNQRWISSYFAHNINMNTTVVYSLGIWAPLIINLLSFCHNLHIFSTWFFGILWNMAWASGRHWLDSDHTTNNHHFPNLWYFSYIFGHFFCQRWIYTKSKMTMHITAVYGLLGHLGATDSTPTTYFIFFQYIYFVFLKHIFIFAQKQISCRQNWMV